MVLTTAVPGGASESRLRLNRHQNRRAADEREGNRGEQDELPHGNLLQQGRSRENIPNVRIMEN
jgi:hypothetical protein